MLLKYGEQHVVPGEYNKYTEEAKNVLLLAKEEALSCRDNSIEPEHLLLGLLRESEGVAATILKSFEVEFDTVRDAIKSSLPHEKSILLGDISLSSRSKKVIELAVDEIRLLKHDYFGTEHFLLGMIREEKGIAVTVLSSFGITLDQVLTRTIQLHSKPDTSNVPEIERTKPRIITIDADRQLRLHKYILACKLATNFSGVLLLVICLNLFFVFFDETIHIVTGLASAISNSSLLGLHIANWYPLHLLAYFTIAVVCFLCIVLPFSCFVTFILPHYYGIRGGTLKHWLLSFFKGISLRLMNRFLFLELTYLLLVFLPQTWWIWVVLVQFLYSIGMVNLYPTLIFPLFYKYRITPLSEDKVVKQLIALTTRAQTQMCGIFKMEKANQKETERVGLDANAFLMGWGKTRRIVLTQRILNLFPLEEIEVILGHELGHHVHHDIWKRLISRSLLSFGVLFLFNITFHSLSDSPSAVGFEGPLAPLGPYFLILPFSLFIFFFIPLIAIIMYKSYARLNEYRADEFALQMTDNAVAFKNAMIRLANYNAIPIELSPLTNLLSTHPSMASRLEHADIFATKHKGGSSH